MFAGFAISKFEVHYSTELLFAVDMTDTFLLESIAMPAYKRMLTNRHLGR